MTSATAISDPSSTLKVSVIVPVRNGEPYIAACLRSIQLQEYPGDRVEVLVVDNASTDATAALCRSLGVAPLFESRPGAGLARNRALARATGEIIAFTDADCELPPGWLRQLVRGLDGIDAVMGPIESKATDHRFARARAFLHREYLAECRRLASVGRLDRLDTANCGAWRRTLEEAGGFHAEIFPAEDRELGARIAERGGRIGFIDEMSVRHHYERRLLPPMRRARAVGRMWVKMLEIFPKDYFERHFSDALAAIERARSLGVGPARRRRVTVRSWQSLAACAIARSFPTCLAHYREATLLAIRLGILDALGA